MREFTELDMEQFRGAVVLLDLNGTLLPSSGDSVSEPVISALRSLQNLARVYLFSNNPDRVRSKRIASALGLPLLATRKKKPDPRVIREMNQEGRLLVVIGDKLLTDGLLAYLVKARFVRVKRLRSTSDSAFTKMLYALDDALAWIWA